MSATQCFVGIDVAKAQLDIALRPTGARWAVVNDDAGIAALVERLQALQPTLIVLEATGGYQRAAPGRHRGAARRCSSPSRRVGRSVRAGPAAARPAALQGARPPCPQPCGGNGTILS
jgi:hypothetical protein